MNRDVLYCSNVKVIDAKGSNKDCCQCATLEAREIKFSVIFNGEELEILFSII
jgi:hypothetical protein